MGQGEKERKKEVEREEKTEGGRLEDGENKED